MSAENINPKNRYLETFLTWDPREKNKAPLRTWATRKSHPLVKYLLIKLCPTYQQFWHHPGAGEKCKLSGPVPEPLNHHFRFNKTPMWFIFPVEFEKQWAQWCIPEHRSHCLLGKKSHLSKVTSVCIMAHWGHLPTVKIINSIPVYYYTCTYNKPSCWLYCTSVCETSLYSSEEYL